MSDTSVRTSVRGKTVLITGAAKRIGREIALRLAAEGANLALHYNGSKLEAEQTAKDCGGANLFQANLESVPEIEQMFRQIDDRLGGLDCLVNNAANSKIIEYQPIDSINFRSDVYCEEVC